MMAEMVVEKAVCQTCGVEVREESLFCYNCGKSVSDDGPVADAAPIEPSETEIVRPGSRPPLRSAASLRKQRRAYNRQPVEVTWEPHDGSPGAFVIVTLLLTGAAFVLLLLALYLR